MTAIEIDEVSNEIDEIISLLEICVRKHFGSNVAISNVEQATLGGSNRTLLFDLEDGDSTRRLVSRQETYTLDSSPFLSPETQFQLLQLAFAYDLAVPEPIVEFAHNDGLGRGHIISCVAGETLPKRLISAPQFAAAREVFPEQAGKFLAKLHAIPIESGDFLAESADSIDPIAAQRERYDYYGQAHPALDFAFRWLEKNRPKCKKRTIVHGDFRIGNMLMGEGGINAVLDWECSHLGDPLEDLGWLCTLLGGSAIWISRLAVLGSVPRFLPPMKLQVAKA